MKTRNGERGLCSTTLITITYLTNDNIEINNIENNENQWRTFDLALGEGGE
jgi:hypothetical protein